MPIQFSPERWAQVKENARLWWDGELERPLIQLSSWGHDAGREEPKLPSAAFHSFYDVRIPAEAVVDRWDYNLSTLRYHGDAFPQIWPNFGPGVVAAFLGAELMNSAETVWYHPRIPLELNELTFTIDPENPWLQRVTDLTRAALQRWQGAVQIGFTDLGGTLDILSTFRPGEKLLFDLYDEPELVKAKSWEIHHLWWEYFRHFDALLEAQNPGYTAWTSVFSEEPYYMLQCDFAYMLSPEMFDEFVKPELAASCRKLPHAFYHLDGPGQLPHLESLLSIPELKGVQWIPGAGQPDLDEWPEVYQQIRDAGKRIQGFFHYPSCYAVIDRLAEQLGTLQGFCCMISGVPAEEEATAHEFLRKYGVQ